MNVASVKARLKNYASESGRTFQDALTYYGLERTIYRIFVSNYADNFVLKGGIFLYATFNGNYERATTDADFLGKNISNDKNTIKSVFKEILSQDIDDSLTYDLDSIDVEDINVGQTAQIKITAPKDISGTVIVGIGGANTENVLRVPLIPA